ncbi:hypothetical protein ACLK2I_04930 [Escherichia coli]
MAPGRRHRRPGSPVSISWNVAGEEAVRKFKKGDSIAAVVLQVDAERTYLPGR